MENSANPRDEFLGNSAWHGSLELANAILAQYPDVAQSDIHTAATLGDAVSVQRFLALDPAAATAKSGPLGWDALTHLCFSRYLRLEPERSPGFLDAAKALLDAGASANTGFFDNSHQPSPEWESVLYGAAGVAQHAGMTRLLLEHGADPNDNEVPYHSPETYDNDALKVLVESGKLTADSLAVMLLRKADFHDLEGARYLLQRGADPNRFIYWPHNSLHQSLRRDNDAAIVELMLKHGADANLPNRQENLSALDFAILRGRGDLLDLFANRGIAIPDAGLKGLLAACARNDRALAQSILTAQPELTSELQASRAARLAEFAGTGNREGVAMLLDLGVEVDARYYGDAYFDIAPNSTALHVAAWRASHRTVELLIERGADVNAKDGRSRTPLMLAVNACVDSYWMRRRAPDSVKALLAAGASRDGIKLPTGYDAIDELLLRS